MICKLDECNNEVPSTRKLFCSKTCLNRHSSRSAHKRNWAKKHGNQPITCKYKNCDNFVEAPQRVFCSAKCKNLHGVIQFRKRTRVKLKNHMGGKCQVCGYDKCYRSLEFHHLDPDVKEFTIGSSTRGWASLLKEAEKCILLCSNCHREVHCGMLKVSVRAVTPAR